MGGRFGHGRKFLARGAEFGTAGAVRLKATSQKGSRPMDILFLLVPLSVGLVLLILGGLWWAIDRGQFDDIEGEGERILREP
jgi:cbb3-type cytochrome oxidase maturation protein